jgi:hypothetical protein
MLAEMRGRLHPSPKRHFAYFAKNKPHKSEAQPMSTIYVAISDLSILGSRLLITALIKTMTTPNASIPATTIFYLPQKAACN